MSDSRPPQNLSPQQGSIAQSLSRPPNPPGPNAPRPVIPSPMQNNPLTPPGPPPQAQPPKPVVDDDEPIELVEGEDEAPMNTSRIKAFGVAEMAHRSGNWKRQTSVNSTGAVRVRTFHGRLSDQGLEYLDNAINEWMDNTPNIEIKFVTSTVGLYDGKIKEPALILNIWY